MSMYSKRWGKVLIFSEVYSGLEVARLIKALGLRLHSVDLHEYRDSIVLSGTSPLFEELELGDKIKHYVVSLATDPCGTVYVKDVVVTDEQDWDITAAPACATQEEE